MKNQLLAICIGLSIVISCKKDEEEATPPSINITHTSGYTINLPKSIVFTASSSGAESVSWDFGDGTTGQGFTAQHSYAAYGNYQVKATATKGGLSSSQTRDVPVTFHRRVVIKTVEVMQVPAFKAAGVDWDPGTLPDLTFKITFPGDTVYETTSVLNNVESGIFNIIPPKGTSNFSDNISIDVYDLDAGNVPDRELMANAKFKFCNVLPVSSTYVDSVQINSGALRLKLKFEFQL